MHYEKNFGEVRYSEGETGTKYRFQGQRSTEFDLYDFNARFYDARLGRFVQPDSVVPLASQGVQAWDRYAGLNNNPIKNSDPTGHYACDDDECDIRIPIRQDRSEISEQDRKALLFSIWIETSEGIHSIQAITWESWVAINRYFNDGTQEFMSSLYSFVGDKNSADGLNMELLNQKFNEIFGPDSSNLGSLSAVSKIFNDVYLQHVEGYKDPTHGSIFAVHLNEKQYKDEDFLERRGEMAAGFSPEDAALQNQIYPFYDAMTKPYWVSYFNGSYVTYVGNHICVPALSCGPNWISGGIK